MIFIRKKIKFCINLLLKSSYIIERFKNHLKLYFIMELKQLRNYALDLFVAGTTAVAGANANAQVNNIYNPSRDLLNNGSIILNSPTNERANSNKNPSSYLPQARQVRTGLTFDGSHYEAGVYVAVLEHEDHCTLIGGLENCFIIDQPRQPIPNNRQVTEYCVNIPGEYCIRLRTDNKTISVGHAHLETGDKLKFYRINGDLKEGTYKFHTRPSEDSLNSPRTKAQVPTLADPRKRPKKYSDITIPPAPPIPAEPIKN
jgi:hypothetical protein